MSKMSRILQNAESIKNSLADIQDAVNTKGAEIDEGDDLNTWAGKIIANIQGQFPPKAVNNGSAYLSSVLLRDVLEIPTVDSAGNPINGTLGTSVPDSAWYVLFGTSESLIIPAYFTELNPTNIRKPVNSPLKYIRVDSETVSKDCDWFSFENLTELNLNGATAMTFGYINAFSKAGLPKLTVNIPNATTVSMGTYAGSGDPTAIREIDINMNKMTELRVGLSSSSTTNRDFAMVNGTIYLPKCQTITRGGSGGTGLGLKGYIGTTGAQIWRMPALTQMLYINYPWTGGNATSPTKVYIGKNFTGMTGSASFKTSVEGGTIELHLPSGDSTSKTYFETTVGIDSQYIHYDYDTTYPEDLQ